MQREDARKVITSALWLAKERVTGELEPKERQRERLSDLLVRMQTGADAPPGAGDLLEVLNGQDPEIAEAIEGWTQGGTASIPQ